MIALETQTVTIRNCTAIRGTAKALLEAGNAVASWISPAVRR